MYNINNDGDDQFQWLRYFVVEFSCSTCQQAGIKSRATLSADDSPGMYIYLNKISDEWIKLSHITN